MKPLGITITEPHIDIKMPSPAIWGGSGSAMGMKTSTFNVPRALVADDQPEVMEALRLLLKGEGIQPYAVSSPAAVLEALKGHHFDIVLMDLNYARDTTSGREGLDLLTQIREMDGTIPVVVMTGWGSVDLAVEAMRRGVQDFVQKPWENERLVNTLRTHIAQGLLVRKGQRLDAEMKMMDGEISAAADLHVMLKQTADHLLRALRVTSVSHLLEISTGSGLLGDRPGRRYRRDSGQNEVRG